MRIVEIDAPNSGLYRTRSLDSLRDFGAANEFNPSYASYGRPLTPPPARTAYLSEPFSSPLDQPSTPIGLGQPAGVQSPFPDIPAPPPEFQQPMFGQQPRAQQFIYPQPTVLIQQPQFQQPSQFQQPIFVQEPQFQRRSAFQPPQFQRRSAFQPPQFQPQPQFQQPLFQQPQFQQQPLFQQPQFQQQPLFQQPQFQQQPTFQQPEPPPILKPEPPAAPKPVEIPKPEPLIKLPPPLVIPKLVIPPLPPMAPIEPLILDPLAAIGYGKPNFVPYGSIFVEETKKLKKRNKALMIAIIILCLLLAASVAALIYVVLNGGQALTVPKVETTSLQFSVTRIDLPYSAELANPRTYNYVLMSKTFCDMISNQYLKGIFVLTQCAASEFQSSSGVMAMLQITVQNLSGGSSQATFDQAATTLVAKSDADPTANTIDGQTIKQLSSET